MDEIGALGEELRESAPPAPEFESLVERARHRRRRRAGILGAGLAMSVVAAVLSVGFNAPDRPAEATGLVISESWSLDDGDLIEVTLEDSTEVAFVAQCAVEVVDIAFLDGAADPELREWCTSVIDDPGRVSTMEVSSTVSTPEGPVDCSAMAGRCVTIARIPAGVRWEYLHFSQTEPPGQPTLTLEPSEVSDGQMVRVTGYGGAPGQVLTLNQCIGTPGAVSGACDAARGTEVKTDAEGHFEAEVLAFREILIDDPDRRAMTWAPCEPCVFRLFRHPDDGAVAAIDIEPTDRPIIPTVEIVGSTVTEDALILDVIGTGYQARQGAQLGLCPEPPAGELASCGYPDSGFFDVDELGQFRIDLTILRSSLLTLTGSDCRTLPAPCVLGDGFGSALGLMLAVPLPPPESGS